ncbi:sigma 54-interacting transcriptional regulator [Marinilactibacillus psychrotolerans]|uniref:Transcriptional regulator n=1 Tax=Marinilactibacillus psychrotolerans TaxID=191770 RepID=A0AAV3WVG4_9LACT|nr:sigma-54-dependent transcriptional regulator [Marinilactibacillus psychrotolerans]GEL67033.1 transcription antiterminator BglG [Marinilactibacillus psychrotolerans]GEQ36178.1 transcriptional regulator [Marinilactibacillus psychrotolerans]SDC76989.1 Transcriptional regulatory protein LevR, contains PRD, AAA+ and EIIA domains [Marinilactibacillus psychrotolerans]
MLREKLADYLKNQTAFFDQENVSDIFTAKKIAEKFEIKRNTVSHYLSQLNEQEIIVKINTRPVYFLHKEAFENQFYLLSKTIYSSLEELKNDQPLFYNKADFFSVLIGNRASLSRSIEQLKTAVYYPDNGLPVILTGESGTGKSYMVKMLHQFCLINDLIEEDAPFVTLNCAQYANNPELLTSQLFGHVKGAYTGAEENRKGAFEEAEGGILFLDEVHRLNAEGQEKLFTYLDQGIIYRMGESNNPRKVKVRLFFATTEDISSNFLTTFMRRIPIRVELPPLSSRTPNERLEMIYDFLVKEQRKIKVPLVISGQVLHLLKNGTYKGNIGELKNVVKVTTANAFSMQREQAEVKVAIHHLSPEFMLHSVLNTSAVVEESIRIDESTVLENLVAQKNPDQQRIVHTYKKLLIEFSNNKLDLTESEESMKQEVENLFDFLIFETDREQKQELLLFMTQYVRDTLRQMEASYQIAFNGNTVYAISYYLFQRSTVRWQPDSIELINLIKECKEKVAQIYTTQYQYTERLLTLIQPKLDIEILDMDKILLTLYLDHLGVARESTFAKAIIVAHGYATASSIANVVNKMLGKNIFESFDMPLDTTPQKIAEEIVDYSEKNDISNGLVILVDMGSLKDIYEYFPQQLTAPIMIMNNVTTPMALTIGENIQKELSLSDIAIQSESYLQLDWKLIYPEENKAKVLLTTCLTGIGTAKQISQLLEESLPVTSRLKVIPYDYETLYHHKTEETVFSLYDVIGIIGTANPLISDVPYLSLEELISGEGAHNLSYWLKKVMSPEENEQFNNRMIRNFSIKKVIDSVTILDTDKVMLEIELFMRRFEELTEQEIANERKIALYVHISCLIERLIRHETIETYSGISVGDQCQQNQFKKIKEAFSVIEENYSVKIPQSELAYVHDIIFQKLDLKATEDEF